MKPITHNDCLGVRGIMTFKCLRCGDGIFDSNGAIIDEGIASVCAYGKIAKCVSLASGKIPQIAIIAGVCSGSMAAVAQMFDISIAVNEKARLYFSDALPRKYHMGGSSGAWA